MKVHGNIFLLLYEVPYSYVPARNKELDLKILMDPFQLKIFYELRLFKYRHRCKYRVKNSTRTNEVYNGRQMDKKLKIVSKNIAGKNQTKPHVVYITMSLKIHWRTIVFLFQLPRLLLSIVSITAFM